MIITWLGNFRLRTYNCALFCAPNCGYPHVWWNRKCYTETKALRSLIVYFESFLTESSYLCCFCIRRGRAASQRTREKVFSATCKKLIRFFSKAFTASIIDHHLGRQWLLAKKQLTANDNSGRVNDSQRKLEVTERGIALDVEDKVLSRGKRRNTCCKNHLHTWLWAERKRGLNIGREERLASKKKITTILFFKKISDITIVTEERRVFMIKCNNKMNKLCQQLF